MKQVTEGSGMHALFFHCEGQEFMSIDDSNIKHVLYIYLRILFHLSLRAILKSKSYNFMKS